MRRHALLMLMLAIPLVCASCHQNDALDRARARALRWRCDVQDRLYAGNAETKKAARKEVIAALDDPDSVKRSIAAHITPRVGDEAIEPLIRTLSDEHPNVRIAAADALGFFKDARAAEALVRTLSDKQTRWAAKNALVRIGPGAVEPLIASLPCAEKQTRSLKIQALGEIGDPRAMGPLIGMLGQAELQDVLVRAVARFGPAAVPRLANVFQNASDTRRIGAAKTLGAIGGASAAEALIAALPPSKGGGAVRQATVAALGQIGKPAIPKLIANLADAGDDRRYYIVCALALIADPAAAEDLVALLGEDEQWIRTQAAFALRRIGKPATDVLIKGLAGAGPPHAREIVAVLHGLHRDRATNLLLAKVRDPKSPLREAAARATRWLPTVNMPIVDAALTDDDSLVLRTALRLLALHPDGKPRPLVAASLKPGARPEVRVAAAAAMGFSGQRANVPDLLAALQDDESSVRAAAADALGVLCGFFQPPSGAVVYPATPADLRAEEPLIRAFSDTHIPVRTAVVTALGKLGMAGPARAKALLAALKDKAWQVREAAATALNAVDYGGRCTFALLRILLDDNEHEAVRIAALPAALRLPRAGRVLLHRLRRDPQTPRRLREAARRMQTYRPWRPPFAAHKAARAM